MGVFPGDLIKLQDDHDPKTHEDEAVYYFDRDWFRHPFPNQRVYFSWYRDWSGVKQLTREEMAEIRMAGPVNYRPGTRLVKVPSIPKVYAVEPGGVLRWITSETVAKKIYGTGWQKRVDDLSEAFFVNYKEGAPLRAATWPTGSLVRDPADESLYLIDGFSRRHVSVAVATALRLNPADALDGGADISLLPSGPTLVAAESRLLDTSEQSRLETLPPPQFDFPAPVATAVRGTDQSLYNFRLTAGAPITLRRFTARISGPVGQGGVPFLSDLRLVTAEGESLFGTVQLPDASADEAATVVWNGAYTMQATTDLLVELRAKISPEVVLGSRYVTDLPRSGLKISGGYSAEVPADFLPLGELPAETAMVR